MEVIKVHDCTVIEGYRPPSVQIDLYYAKRSKVKFGKHNVSPSNAVDVGPYLGEIKGIPWPVPGSDTYIKDLNQFYYFAGIVHAKAREMGISIRWGGDWDRDHYLSDQTFDDLVHFQLL